MSEVRHDSVDACIDSVSESWDETRLAESWMVAQWHVDEYDHIKLNKTHCNYKNGDKYVSLSMLGRMIGQENGHSDEYLDKFQVEMLKFLWATIGRAPVPEPLPLAKHLKVLDDDGLPMTSKNGDHHENE